MCVCVLQDEKERWRREKLVNICLSEQLIQSIDINTIRTTTNFHQPSIQTTILHQFVYRLVCLGIIKSHHNIILHFPIKKSHSPFWTVLAWVSSFRLCVAYWIERMRSKCVCELALRYLGKQLQNIWI